MGIVKDDPGIRKTEPLSAAGLTEGVPDPSSQNNVTHVLII